MLCDYDQNLMPMNMRDGVDFKKDSKCIWILYRPGAMGDLLGAIVNMHFINTGCEYYGITDKGQVMFMPADNKGPTRKFRINNKEYDKQFLYEVADELGDKCLNYSLLDNILFTDHITKYNKVVSIINSFPNGKFIAINCKTDIEVELSVKMSLLKNLDNDIQNNKSDIYNDICNDNLLVIQLSEFFTEKKFNIMYSKIIEFLDLKNMLINYNFIDFYFSKQHPELQDIIKKLQNC
jgi:hypothetical protein